MKRFLRNNGLSVAMFLAFMACFIGQSFAGLHHHNDERREHGRPEIGYGAYLRSGDFLEATFENWESEFFQMAAFVVLSAVLIQRGAAESHKPDEPEEDPYAERTAGSPGPVHRGGLALALYSRSLSLALGALFLISFALHAVTGVRHYNEEAAAHGQPALSVAGYLGSSQFWFESLQNWQSEFLSVFALVVLSIFLRQKGSPESKKVHAPHAQTGPD
jgi:hypothetical protein